MKKLTTLTALAGAALVGSSQAAITVGLHETFNDNATPAGLTVQNGTPTYSGGSLVLDNTTWLSGASGIGAQTDNFGLEVIGTFAAFEVFDFMAALTPNLTANQGIGILAQAGNFNGLASGAGFFGSVAQDTNEHRFAVVRDGGDNKFYVDGILVNQQIGQAFNGDTSLLNLGAHPFDDPNGQLNGSINEVRTFTFAAGAFDDSTDLLTAPTPEPSSTALLGLGGLALILRRRK